MKFQHRLLELSTRGEINNIVFLGERMGYQARERMNSSFKSVPVLNKTVVIMSKHILLKLYGFLLRYSFEF